MTPSFPRHAPAPPVPARGPRDLLIVGAGGFARETIEAVNALNAHSHRHSPVWHLLGVLDDDPARHGGEVAGATVLGGTELVHQHPDARVLICTGRPTDQASRYRIAARLDLPDHRYATLVHPAASVGSSCRTGPGTVLLAHVTATADVTLGRHVCVMPQTVLTHDTVLGDFATLASGVRLGGGTTVGRGAYLGAGALAREGTRIGDWSMLGMGSVLTRDLPERRVWFGAPARDVRAAEVDLPDAVPGSPGSIGRSTRGAER